MLGTSFYLVDSIDGDYANLKLLDDSSEELKLVARALLPDGIQEGMKLKYECFQYTIEA